MSRKLSTGSVRESADRMCRFRAIRGNGFRAAVEITRRCNIACLHCFVPNERTEPSLETLTEVFHGLETAGCRKLILTGGEPLLRNDLEDIIRAATQAGIAVDLNSNLYDLSESRAEALVLAGLTEASTSFYGDRGFHDQFVRRQGAYESTIESCRRLRARGVDLDIHGPVWSENLDHVNHVYELSLRLGADSLTLFRVVGLSGTRDGNLFGETRFGAHVEQFHAPLYEALMELIAGLRKREEIPVRTIGFAGSLCEECEQAESIVGITADMSLSPCLLSRRQEEKSSVVDGTNLKQTLSLLREEVAQGLWQPVCNPMATGETP